MAHRLRMSAELGDWLTELCAFQPASGSEVGATLVALMNADDLSSLPMVGAPGSGPRDPREVVDYAYQELLEALQEVRRTVADVATDRKHWAIRVQEAEAAGRPDEVRAQLHRRLADAEQREHQLAERSQRTQLEVDRLRTAKETAKAMYTAAEATVRIQDAIAAATGNSPAPNDEELAAHSQALAGAEATLQTAAAQAARTLGELRGVHRPGTDTQQDDDNQPTEPVTGLLELRADPLGRDVRLLLALEPADTVTLLAVLDGEDAVAEHRVQAIELARDLLTDIRAGNWPPDDALGPADLDLTFADAAPFLSRFFPADGGAIEDRAAAFTGAQSLAGLRRNNRMSLADLAIETGISEERLRSIEDSGLRVAQVHEAMAYVRALGLMLTITADRSGEPTIIVG